MKITSIHPISNETSLQIPLVENRVKAGFPSPADDHLQKGIDLNQELVPHPAATFFVRVSGDSMKDAGIIDGDTLVVDRSLTPTKGQVVVALVNGEFTVKYFFPELDRVVLKAANIDYPDIEVFGAQEFEVWGVVTSAIHQLQKT